MNNKNKNSIDPLKMFLWLGLLSLAWPMIHLAVAYIRFGSGFAGGFVEALVFLPMGAISGGFLLYWIAKATTRPQRLVTLLGYLVASPMAFIGSLGGGLFLPALIGATLFGGMPLILGAFFGFYLSRNIREE